MARKIKNIETGEIVEVNCVDFNSNTIRLDVGTFEAYPTAWEENKETIATQCDVATDYLLSTGKFEIVAE